MEIKVLAAVKKHTETQGCRLSSWLFRGTGFFLIADLNGNPINQPVDINVKKNCKRLKARTTTLIEKRKIWSEV